MIRIQIIHNPTAGDGRHSKKSLLQLFSGFCDVASYLSTEEEGWSNFPKERAEIIYIAGGDGTVRKVARVLYKSKIPQNEFPAFGLLALGTANNIADTLSLPSNEEVPKINPLGERRPFDCGRIEGLKEEDFLMESFGAGVFPELIKRTEEEEVDEEDPSRELQRVLKILIEIVKNYKPEKAEIKTDGISITGSFLMVEVMNIQSVGPNLKMVPDADPGDGYFDLVLVTEEKRAVLLEYLEKRINGQKPPEGFKNIITSFRVQKLELKWGGNRLHVDDTLINAYNGEELKLKILPGLFEYIH